MNSEATGTTSSAPQSIWGPEWGVGAHSSIDHPGLHLPDFDLSYLYSRVCRDLKHLVWTKADFDAAVREYKVLWANMKAEPDVTFRVPQNADMIWHLHLLFTHFYADDCDAYFGKFLHHHPEEGEGARAPECGGGIFGQCAKQHHHLRRI